jgi:hypothetical protein
MIPKFASELRNLNHTSFNKLVARLPLKFASEFQGRDTRAQRIHQTPIAMVMTVTGRPSLR